MTVNPSRIPMPPPTHVIIGETRDWQHFVVIDLDTARALGPVVEVDAEAGWVVLKRYNARGTQLLSDGHGKVFTERREGRFAIFDRRDL